MATKTKAVTKKEEAALPISVEEMEALSGQGFEEADKDSYAIPFLRILQSNSPQVDEAGPAYIDGAKPGMFFNTVTGKLYEREVSVIPIHYTRDFVEWKPNREGFVQSHGNDPTVLDRVVRVDDKNNSILDNGNIIQDARNHFVLLADNIEAGPVIFSLSSTGIRHSKKWMSLMNALRIPGSSKQAPMFAGIWKLQAVRNSNDDGVWYQIGDRTMTGVEFQSWVTKEQLSAATEARKLVMSGEAHADYESTIDGETRGDSGNRPMPQGSDEDVPF